VCSSFSLFDLPHIKPEHQVVYLGTNAEIMCFSFQHPKWSKRSESVQSKYTFGARLNIPVVKTKHSGQYYCEGYDINQFKFTAMSEIIVASKF